MIKRIWQQISGASRYSWDGFVYMARGEMAFRVQILFILIVLIIYLVFGAPAHAYIISLVLFFILIAFEALNTAIEVVVDEISPHISPMAKHAKDLGSLSVLLAYFANGLYALWVVYGILFKAPP